MLPLSIPNNIDKYFFNRKNDIKRINLITSSIYQDLPSQILITGQRGVGKTFLLKKILHDQKKDTLTIYIDISKIYAECGGKLSEEIILKELLNQIIDSINKEENNKLIEKIKKLFINLKLKDYIFEDSNSIFDIPIPNIKDNYQKLSSFVMELPQKIVDSSEKYKGMIIVIDEFQHLKYVQNSSAFFWLFRSHIQNQSNVSYIFTGSVSKTSDVIEMINGQTGAFGGRMVQINIEPFSKEETLQYLNERATEIKFSDDGFNRFYNCTQGIPSYINAFISVLDSNTVYNDKMIKETFLLKMDQIVILWLYTWGNLSNNEKNIVKFLVSNESSSLKELIEELNISKNTILKNLDFLANKSIVKHCDNKYLINDNMLKTWLKYKKEIDGYYPV